MFVVHEILLYVYIFAIIYIIYLIFVIAPPMTAPTLTEPSNLMNRSFTVNWKIANSTYIYSYIITWTNLRTGDTNNIEVQANTFSYEVTGLNGVDNYNASVTANNSCGMMRSDSITVYGKVILYTLVWITFKMY